MSCVPILIIRTTLEIVSPVHFESPKILEHKKKNGSTHPENSPWKVKKIVGGWTNSSEKY